MNLAHRTGDISPENTIWLHSLSEYWEAFIDFLQDQNLNEVTDIEKIISVCQKIERDFSTIIRKTGEPYTAHLYEATRLYITLHEEQISQKGVIICLLHDNIEDIGIKEYEEIKSLYGEEIAFCVLILSKPKLQDGESKEERNIRYNERFENISVLQLFVQEKAQELKIKLSSEELNILTFTIGAIKISDRAHNLITLDLNHFSLDQVIKKIQETEDYIIPLAQSMGNIFLVDILRKELIKLSTKIHKRKTEEVLNWKKV